MARAKGISEARPQGNDVTDIGIHFWHLSPQYPPGRTLFFSQMGYHKDGIDKYINEACNILPIAAPDGKTIYYSFDQNGIPDNLIYSFKKWFQPRPNFQLSDAELMQWQKDYTLFLDSRPDLRPLLLAKGIDYAEIILKHCQQYEPKNLQQIDSLQRRIVSAKRLVGIGANKKPETPKRQPSEREREALYKYYMGTFPEKGKPLYNETLDWAKDNIRLHSNGSKKSRNSKKSHMEAVLKRVLSEKKQGWENRRERIEKDIIKLLENFG